MKTGVVSNRPEGLAELAARWSEWIIHAVKLVFVVIVTVFLAVNAIPAAREWLKHFGFLDESVVAETVGIAFILTLGLLHRLDQKIGQLTVSIQDEQFMRSGRMFGGVGEVFPHLRAAIESHPKNEPKTLEVLGLTLYATWPQVQAWLTSEAFRGWTIVLTALSPEFLKTAPYCPPAWPAEADAVRHAILDHAKSRRAELAGRQIVLEFFMYEAFPAVHGFRLGGRDVFVSFEHWSDIAPDRIDEPVQFYERILGTDDSLRAQAYRNLFGNWIDHAKRSATTKSVQLG